MINTKEFVRRLPCKKLPWCVVIVTVVGQLPKTLLMMKMSFHSQFEGFLVLVLPNRRG